MQGREIDRRIQEVFSHGVAEKEVHVKFRDEPQRDGRESVEQANSWLERAASRMKLT